MIKVWCEESIRDACELLCVGVKKVQHGDKKACLKMLKVLLLWLVQCKMRNIFAVVSMNDQLSWFQVSHLQLEDLNVYMCMYNKAVKLCKEISL